MSEAGLYALYCFLLSHINRFLGITVYRFMSVIRLRHIVHFFQYFYFKSHIVKFIFLLAGGRRGTVKEKNV